ncbi:MAG TPA: Tar ligand binding domain-containing protein, partial [Aquabacterium sp.]|nr:Tar ligand binding domain-containing protein [Aquabacterium sp.]
MRNNQPVTDVEYVLRDNQSLISRTDAKGRITYANDDFIEAAGFTEAELIGKPHNLVRHPDMPEAAFEDMWRDLKAGLSWTGMVKNRRKDGGFYWVLANASPILEGGTVVGYSSVRTKPTQEQVAAAEAVYRRFRTGQARGLRIRHGQVIQSGPLGWIDRLLNLTLCGRFRLNMVLTSLVMLALALGSLLALQKEDHYVERIQVEGMQAHDVLLDIRAAITGMNTALSDALINRTPENMSRQASQIEGHIQAANKAWAAYLALPANPRTETDRETFSRRFPEVVNGHVKPTIQALNAHDVEGALSFYNGSFTQSLKEMRANLNAQINGQ